MSKDWDADEHVESLLQSIIRDHSILQRKTKTPALAALKACLRDKEDQKALPELYTFLDNCILRLVRKPIKYRGDADKFSKEISRSAGPSDGKGSPISLLHFTLLEQWPFLVEAGEHKTIENVAFFLSGYLYCSEAIGEDAAILQAVRNRMWKLIAKKPYASLLDEHFRKSTHEELSKDLRNGSKRVGDATAEAVEEMQDHKNHQAPPPPDPFILDSELPEENEDHPGLNRWSTEDIEVAIEDGAVGELLFCLCSKHSEIRKQALVNIRILLAKLKVSMSQPSDCNAYRVIRPRDTRSVNRWVCSSKS